MSAIAGCAQKPAPEAQPSPSDLPVPETPRPVFQFQNCTSVILVFEVPRALIEPVLPHAFQIAGLTATTGSLRVIAESCPRTVGPDAVYGATSQYWAFAFVSPKNHSWSERGYINWYLFDYATTSSALAERFRDLDLLPTDVASITLSETALPTSGRLMEWKVEAGNYSALFHYRTNPDQPQWSGDKIHLWFGTSKFKRVDVEDRDYVDSLLAGGEFVLQGQSRLGTILKTPLAPWRGTSSKDISSVWTVNPQDYQ